MPVVLVGLLMSATQAQADIGETIILRCTHAQSLSGFSQSAYKKALKELSADSEEYSGCASQIRQAQLAAATVGHGAGAAASAAAENAPPLLATPAEQRSIARAVKAKPVAVRVGGTVVSPGVVHTDIASAFSSLPGPLLAVLAFLLVCAALVAAGITRSRIRGKRSR